MRRISIQGKTFATASLQATATPAVNSALPLEYVYAIVAVIVIALIAVVAYIYLKGSKNEKQLKPRINSPSVFRVIAH